MTKMRKLFISAIALGSLAVVSIGSTYAFFKISQNHNASISTDITSEEVIQVSSFIELFEGVKNDNYNDASLVSNVRKIIRLSDDITLLNDLDVTKDVHIDLNGYKLELNGYQMTISHNYNGTFMIRNGSIYPYDEKGKAGRIVIDTPKATILKEDLICYDYNNIEISSEQFINVEDIDENYTAYLALKEVSDSFASDLSRRKDVLSFNEFETTYSSSEGFKATDFIFENYNSFTSTSEAYNYITHDLDMPLHYLSDDISISYSSSNEDVITSYGELKSVTTYGKVIMSVTLSSSSFENNITCDFVLYGINLNDSEVKNIVGGDMIKAYMKPYYYEGTINVSPSITHNGYYLLASGIQLPLRSDDFDIDYQYGTFKEKSCDSANEVSTESFVNGRIYNFEPTDDCYYLLVEYNGTSIILNTYSTYISSLETVARLILNTIYGGSFVYDETSDNHTLTSWSELKNDERLKDLINAFNVTNIEYSIDPGSDASEDYSITKNGDKDVLTLEKSKPSKNKEGYLRATFTINGITHSEKIYIIYVNSGGDSINSFLTYYTIFSKIVPSSSTLEEFEMPLSYNDAAPYVTYDFASSYSKSTSGGVITYNDVVISKPSVIVASLIDKDGNIITSFDGEINGTLTTKLDQYLLANGYSKNSTPDISKLIAAYPGAKWKFSFEKSKISLDDIESLMIYNYKFGGTSSWTQFGQIEDDDIILSDSTTSILTLEGGLYYQLNGTSNNSIRDKDFFIYLYNKVNTDGVILSSSSPLDEYAIINDWFSLIDSINANEENLLGVTDWNGIQYLNKCKDINVSNINNSLTSTTIASQNYTLLDLICQLDSIEKLDISNMGLSYSYNQDNNEIINNLLKLKNTIKSLNIANNNIEKYEWLNEFINLDEVYFYTNTASITTLSSYYGSEGMCNFQTYEDLSRKGISVYYLINSNNVPVLFENSLELNDYQRLKSIEYQDKLSKEVSIENIYSQFINISASTFGLSNSGTLTWTYGGGSDQYDATYFQVTYSFNVSGYSIQLIVKYYVDRY